MKKIIHVVGTRPNYVKAAPVISALSGAPQFIVNTGQHYDKTLSSDIIQSLEMKKPDISLSVPKNIDSLTRLSFFITSLSDIFKEVNPALVVVYGDVDSTLAASLVASKLDLSIAHVESGLRSFDNTMPEEVNRRIVDQISTLHFVTEASGFSNLLAEGHSRCSIFHVGNSMIDSLISIINSVYFKTSDWNNHNNMLLTCHRPSNVDNLANLKRILNMCEAIEDKIVWPLHPRTEKNIKKFNLWERFNSLKNLNLTNPLNYCDFVKMMSTSRAVITDSGGIQEETTYLGVPCFTVRENTERPSTINIGTNALVSFEEVVPRIEAIKNNLYNNKSIPPLWDGMAGPRIAKHIKEYLNKKSEK
jgi:UDP-N-acetylglucosamine 2-epimerase (non-hydrolysing)